MHSLFYPFGRPGTRNEPMLKMSPCYLVVTTSLLSFLISVCGAEGRSGAVLMDNNPVRDDQAIPLSGIIATVQPRYSDDGFPSLGYYESRMVGKEVDNQEMASVGSLFDMALPLIPIRDDFESGSLNPQIWSPIDATPGATLTLNSGYLNYVVSASFSDDDHAVLELLGARPGYNESWGVIVDVSNTAPRPSTSQFSGAGIMILAAEHTDRHDEIFVELGNEHASSMQFFSNFITNDQDDPETDAILNTGGTSGSIRISYDGKSKVFSTFVDRNGSGDGFQWEELDSYGIAGSGGARNTQWNMTSEGFFIIALYGLSSGIAVELGAVTFDNFVFERDAEMPRRVGIEVQGNSVRLAWPITGPHVRFEETASLLDPRWTEVQAEIVREGDELTLLLPRTDTARFFRLAPAVDPGPNMALIPSGSFEMGDSFSEGNHDEMPIHTVYVSAFYMDRTPVTKALWDEVYGWAIDNGYSFDNPGWGSWKSDQHPVHSVNWFDVVKWCNARSEMEGQVPAYYTSAEQTMVYRTGRVGLQSDWVKWNAGYRLPTEAEWEKAARGGLKGRRFPWGDTITHGDANYHSRWDDGQPYYPYDVTPTSGYHPIHQRDTSPVGSFEVNGYGLDDMAGNVREWCWDLYSSSYYSSSPGVDPRGPSSGSERVRRGGAWRDSAFGCRVAFREYAGPQFGDSDRGFRSVLPLP